MIKGSRTPKQGRRKRRRRRDRDTDERATHRDEQTLHLRQTCRHRQTEAVTNKQ